MELLVSTCRNCFKYDTSCVMTLGLLKKDKQFSFLISHLRIATIDSGIAVSLSKPHIDRDDSTHVRICLYLSFTHVCCTRVPENCVVLCVFTYIYECT